MILNLYNSKDASAAAIYGRAANGVIVITTKKRNKRS
jgi:TonB-dependent SusC/RagA subfamily outer membrane receptor